MSKSVEKNQATILKEPPKTFTTIDAHTLLQRKFKPLQFAIEKILPHGLFILAGSGKIGKSWLALDICRAVAAGDKVWDFSAEQGEVLYLALEDNYRRLHDRLKKIGVCISDNGVGGANGDGVGNNEKKITPSGGSLVSNPNGTANSNHEKIAGFHLTTASFGISTGLFEQIHAFMARYPNTKLIVVDTLERIRDTALDKSIYACDYRDMMALREITDKYKLTLLLVHHTRKLHDDDPLNTLSGSMGLVGAADGVLVLQKLKRVGDRAILTVANRDTEEFCFALEFDREHCKWVFKGNHTDAELTEEDCQSIKNEWLCLLVDDFLKQAEWTGTATELAGALNEIDGGSGNVNISHLTIKRQLLANAELLLQSGISIDERRNAANRKIILHRCHADAQTTAMPESA